MTHLPLIRFLPWRRHDIMLAVASGFCAGALASCAVLSGASPGPTATATTASSSASVPIPHIDKLREQAVNDISPTVVKVQNVGVGLGSGVILTKNGYIVTNYHVVANAHQITVTLANGDTLAGSLTGTDPVDDLAVVKVNQSSLPTATLGDSSRLQVGQTVMAIGNPLGITRTVTDGIVSALSRTVQEGQGSRGSIPNAIQTSAPINPGNSGGALVNLGGQLIGIPTLAAVDPEFGTQAAGIGFAIPSNTVKRITDQLIKYHKVRHSGRAAIGILATSVNPTLAAQYNLPVSHGVLVAGIESGGGAARAGMKKGEVIVRVGNTAINSESDLLDVLAKQSPGGHVTVTVVTSGGSHHTYHVTLGELPINSTS